MSDHTVKRMRDWGESLEREHKGGLGKSLLEYAEAWEKQLAERDAALARCVEALETIEVLDRQRMYHGCPDCDDDSCSVAIGCKVAKYSLTGINAVKTLASLLTSTQATAKVLAAARALDTVGDESQGFWDAVRVLYEAVREEQEYRSSDNS